MQTNPYRVTDGQTNQATVNVASLNHGKNCGEKNDEASNDCNPQFQPSVLGFNFSLISFCLKEFLKNYNSKKLKIVYELNDGIYYKYENSERYYYSYVILYNT